MYILGIQILPITSYFFDLLKSKGVTYTVDAWKRKVRVEVYFNKSLTGLNYVHI